MRSREKLEQAIRELRRGRVILLHDDESRENETDIIAPAQFADKYTIKMMRQNAGGLIVLMVSNEVAERFHLPYLSDLYREISDRYPLLGEIIPTDLPYDEKSSFSISINHRETFTGISDIDRSLTVRRFAEISKNGTVDDFSREFRSPGHIPICIARKSLLDERKGHTELAVTIMKISGLIPVAVGCEMIGDDGRSMDREDAERYARKNGFVFVEGYEVEEAIENGESISNWNL